MAEIDFGYGGNSNNNVDTNNVNDNASQVTNLENGSIDHDVNGEPVEDLNETSNNDETNTETNNTDNDNNKETKDNTLESGTVIELENKKYTIDDNGNLLDDKGNIFKEARDVKDWLDSFENVSNDESELSISSIQDAIGIDVHDENNNPIEFENTIDGVKAYIDAVIESNRKENYETAINTLYERYPIVEDFLNYYIANGNSFKGFGELPDRSNITIDVTNEAQQEHIIRTAWTEQGRKGDVEGYINYLKSSGTLTSVAEEELAGLQQADKEYREKLAKQAEANEQARIKQIEEYWTKVNDTIKSKKIAGYQIPDNIIINRNNQKLSVTPNDFFNYLYRVDKDGVSAYEKDLSAETPEQRMEDELLRAYLKFTGGNYSNLVDMAINKKNVSNIKLKAKERNTNTIRIKKPTSNNNKNIDFGYN